MSPELKFLTAAARRLESAARILETAQDTSLLDLSKIENLIDDAINATYSAIQTESAYQTKGI